MKTLTKFVFISLILLPLIGLNSCEKRINDNAGSGSAEFSLNLLDEVSQTKSGEADTTQGGIMSYQILISVEDLEGNYVITDSLIPLYSFGTGWVSENVKIKTGEFKLTKFMVINPSGAVIFATPLAGSPLAYLVNRPLPFNFNIFADRITRIVPEVLSVGDQPPGQFGYANFGMQIVKPLGFWTICIIDNPLIMAPAPMPTTAKLTVFADNNWHYTFKLEATVNHLIIRGGSAVYTFLLEKDGYQPQKMQFTAEQLMATTRDNPLVLKIPWDSQYKVLVLQPGPEDGKDAMVSNLDPDKNFGNHKYFEATFLPEPVLTVMRVNRSMIWFNMNQLPKSAVIRKVTLQLFYDVPIPWDSTILITDSNSTGVVPIGGVLQQITSAWEEDKVTWNTQPTTIETNQIFIPPFVRNVNFIVVDVTRLYLQAGQINTPFTGMMFKLWPTEKFPGFRFASSDFPEPAMRPKLSIYYMIGK
jgi:hypothetical protein